MNIPVVVIIATSKRRTRLLLERALPSVFRQQAVNPECIYIVDDNNCEREYEAIARGAEKVREVYFEEMFPQGIPDDWFRVRVIRNHRTQGHSGSGAWNTGAEAAFRAHTGSSAKYLGILDDDDEWYPITPGGLLSADPPREKAACGCLDPPFTGKRLNKA